MQLPFDVQQNIIPAFVTNVGRFMLPNAAQINPGLIRAIHKRKDENAGQMRSNVGGWHSHDDLFDWPEADVVELKDSVKSAVMHMIAVTSRLQKFKCLFNMDAWANVNLPGDFNAVHMHPQSHWSGVYYVKTGITPRTPDRDEGNLSLLDPRGAVSMITHPGTQVPGKNVVVKAIEGSMVLFPSWLQHGVNPAIEGGERISIAFNAMITQFESDQSGVEGTTIVSASK